MAHTPKTRSEKAVLSARRAWCYLVLVLISFLCLFFFYILIVNSTRTHFEIQKGFSLLPGKSMLTNFKNVLADANIPVGIGIRNSLIVSACSAALSVYFSALTAYGIYAYNFRFKNAAFAHKQLRELFERRARKALAVPVHLVVAQPHGKGVELVLIHINKKKMIDDCQFLARHHAVFEPIALFSHFHAHFPSASSFSCLSFRACCK